MKSRGGAIATTLLSLLILGIAWQFAATSLDMRSLPAPIEVWQSFLTEARSGELILHLSATLLRVGSGLCSGDGDRILHRYLDGHEPSAQSLF